MGCLLRQKHSIYNSVCITSFASIKPWEKTKLSISKRPSMQLGPSEGGPFSVCTGSVFFQHQKVSPGKVSHSLLIGCKIGSEWTIQGGAVTFACLPDRIGRIGIFQFYICPSYDLTYWKQINCTNVMVYLHARGRSAPSKQCSKGRWSFQDPPDF